MRLARKASILIIVMIATFASTAMAVNAAVVVTTEATGVPCSEVDITAAHAVSGGCVVQAETEPSDPFVLRQHAALGGEAVFVLCHLAFSARFHEAGDGFIYNQALAGIGCGLTACDEAEPSHADEPWAATFIELAGFRGVHMTTCTRPAAGAEASSPGFCTIYVPWNDSDGQHQYEMATLAFGPHNGVWQSRCSQGGHVSVSGHWAIAGTPIEISH